MDDKPLLMIHDFKRDYLDLPLKDYTLTFDDGLYSQYFFWGDINKIPTTKIVFVSTGILCTGKQSTDFVSSREAHEKSRRGVFEDFMTPEQVMELHNTRDTTIGGHSHYHRRYDPSVPRTQWMKFLCEDTQLMIDWFDANLNSKPGVFCYPYNDDISGLYNAVMSKYGIMKCVGKERIPLESLI